MFIHYLWDYDGIETEILRFVIFLNLETMA